jgi:hypothetical protein
MKNSAIVVFSYDRPVHLDKCLDSLTTANKADEIPIYIVVDGCNDPLKIKSNNECFKISEKYTSKKKNIKIIKRISNYGLRNNIIETCDELFKKFEYLIVLEDDLIASNTILAYFEWGQKFFKEKYLGQVSAFNYSDFPSEDDIRGGDKTIKNTYLFSRPLSWGWMCSSEIWQSLDWNLKPNKEEWNFISKRGGEDLRRMYHYHEKDKISSWYIIFCINIILKNKLTLFPDVSLVKNIGHDGSGVHGSNKRKSSFVGDLGHFDEKIVEQPFEHQEIDHWMCKKFKFSAYAKFIIPIRDFIDDIF